MMNRFALPFLALLPLATTPAPQSCPGCSLDVGTAVPTDFGPDDPSCDSSVFLDIWGTGNEAGSGSCALGLVIETGVIECKGAAPCTISWSYSVTASGDCVGTGLPQMSWSYFSSTGGFGQTGQSFEPNLPQTGSSSMQCGSTGEIRVRHDGVETIQSATCNPCEPA